MKKPALGDKVRHTITGFEGVVVAFTTWLNGCERLSVQPEKLDKDGKPRDTQVFDIQELEIVKAGTHVPHYPPPLAAQPAQTATRPGGHRASVARGQGTPERGR